MKECNDPSIGQLLHAFELGVLTEKERESFELHLAQCEYCFEKFMQFQEVTLQIRAGEEAREIVSDMAFPSAPSILSRIRAWLLELIPRLKSPKLLLAQMILILAIYAGFTNWLGTGVQQTLYLMPERGSVGNILMLDDGGKAEIIFDMSKANRQKQYLIGVFSPDDEIVISNVDYSLNTEFRGRIIGKVRIPVNVLMPGNYILRVSNENAAYDSALYEYEFMVK
ncbi:MAG: hypothetical protein GF315_08890 [candidate division Zixibacteria bacterium]|nr:hypothetical protein [candidate division Zixibacteria bacterium]